MTLLQALRSATQASHQRLDLVISDEDVTAGMESYALYLERFHAGLKACWPVLDWTLLAQRGLPDLSDRQARYHALTRDLASLDHQVPPLESGHRSDDVASVVGCLYVLEGSIHGGAILLAELERKAGSLPPDKCRFLAGFGDRNRSHWKNFISWLESIDAGNEFLKRAATAAEQAFDHFIAAFGATAPTPSASR